MRRNNILDRFSILKLLFLAFIIIYSIQHGYCDIHPDNVPADAINYRPEVQRSLSWQYYEQPVAERDLPGHVGRMVWPGRFNSSHLAQPDYLY